MSRDGTASRCSSDGLSMIGWRRCYIDLDGGLCSQARTTLGCLGSPSCSPGKAATPSGVRLSSAATGSMDASARPLLGRRARPSRNRARGGVDGAARSRHALTRPVLPTGRGSHGGGRHASPPCRSAPAAGLGCAGPPPDVGSGVLGRRVELLAALDQERAERARHRTDDRDRIDLHHDVKDPPRE